MSFNWWNGVIPIQEFINTPLIYLAFWHCKGNREFKTSSEVYIMSFENLCHSMIFDRVSF